MNKTTYFFLSIFVIALTVSSCKKGDNDPVISFRSRKVRVAGNWNVSKYSIVSNLSGTEEFDGTTVTTTPSQNSSTATQTIVYEHTKSAFSFIFEKDGTWKKHDVDITKKTTTYVGSSPVVVTDTRTVTTDDEGTWNFTGKIGEAKNKDGLVLITTATTKKTDDVHVDGTGTQTSTNTSVTKGYSEIIFQLDELRNKKMVWIRKYDTFNQSSLLATPTTDSFKGTWTLVQN